MPRFFFHFIHDGDRIYDDVGLELPDLRSAHDHAMLLIQQATSHFADAPTWRDWIIEITDLGRRQRLSVLFPVVARAGFGTSSAVRALQTPRAEVR